MCSCFSCIQLFATLWTVANQAPSPMGFLRHEQWSGLPCPSPGDLPKSGIEPVSLAFHALAGRFFTTSTTPQKPPFVTREPAENNEAPVTRGRLSKSLLQTLGTTKPLIPPSGRENQLCFPITKARIINIARVQNLPREGFCRL